MYLRSCSLHSSLHLLLHPPESACIIMEPKPAIVEMEEAKNDSLNRFGDYQHQQKLTRRILFKLDTR